MENPAKLFGVKKIAEEMRVEGGNGEGKSRNPFWCRED
jgi:hypothetical protein